MAKRDNEQAARALVDAALLGDRKAAERHGITDRTLRNYRRALEDDPELSACLERCMRAALEAQEAEDRASWADETSRALIQLTRDALDLWRELKLEAESFTQRLEVLQTALTFIKQLTEPQLVREVMGPGDRVDHAAHQRPAAVAASRSAEHVGPN